jgi:hypothetical protein
MLTRSCECFYLVACIQTRFTFTLTFTFFTLAYLKIKQRGTRNQRRFFVSSFTNSSHHCNNAVNIRISRRLGDAIKVNSLIFQQLAGKNPNWELGLGLTKPLTDSVFTRARGVSIETLASALQFSELLTGAQASWRA